MQTKKTKQKQNKAKRTIATKVAKTLMKEVKRKETPFRDAFGIMGKAAGNQLNRMFSTNMDLTGVGKWLGSNVGWIFGSGDYTIAGQAPTNNVLFNSNQIPQFSSTRATNVVCHREYLTDWTGVTDFTIDQYKLNPGDRKTFPWLSSIAENYTQYKFHGVIFEFRPLITDFVTGGAPGVVIMATNYNADDAPYASKHEMENTEFSVSVKPTTNLVHGIECAADETPFALKQVRVGALPPGVDPNLYDMGSFYFANQGSPNQLLGEIWVSYCVEFFKPCLPNTVGGTIESTFSVRSGVSNANPMGTIQLVNRGNMNAIFTGTRVTFDARPQELYIVSFSWTGGAPVVIGLPALTDTGMFQVAGWFPNGLGVPASGIMDTPPPGVSSASATQMSLYRCDLTSPGRVSITMGVAAGVPTNNMTMFLTRLDISATPPLA